MEERGFDFDLICYSQLSSALLFESAKVGGKKGVCGGWVIKPNLYSKRGLPIFLSYRTILEKL